MEQNIIVNPMDIVKKEIGENTYAFLLGTGQFKRSLDLLATSQALVNYMKDKILIPLRNWRKEYSYIVAPAAKSLEGVLLAIALHQTIISQEEIDSGISIGQIYDNLGGKPARAKKYVLKSKDARMVDIIYGNWSRFRNKTLHYDENYFVQSPKEAEDLVKNIYRTIRDAYQIFIGSPDIKIPLGTKILARL